MKSKISFYKKLINSDSLYWFVGIIFVFIIWYLTSLYIGKYNFPGPIPVFNTIISNYEIHVENVFDTSIRAILGLSISLLVSLILVFGVGVVKRLDKLLYPYLVLIKASPALAFAPIFITLTSSPYFSIVLVSAMISFFPMVIGGIDGMKNIPNSLNNYAKSYGAKSVKNFLIVGFGYSSLGIASGLKTAAPLSVVGAIVGEYVVGTLKESIGGYLIQNYTSSTWIGVYAAAILATLIGLFFFINSLLLSNYLHKRFNVSR